MENFSYFHDAEFEPPLRVKILQEVCESMGLRLEIVQPREGFLCRIWDDDRFINHQVNVCTLNSYNAGLIAKDKTYTYLILQKAGFRVPRGDYYFRSDFFKHPDYSIDRGEYEAIRDGIMLGMVCSQAQAELYLANREHDLLSFKQSLIVKPNSLSLGLGVFRVDTVDALEFAIKKVFSLPNATEHVVIVQEFIEGIEFRLIMLDGELLLCAEKEFGSDNRAIMRDKTSRIPKDYVDWARRASEAMQMRYLGLDFRCKDLSQPANEAVILEVNCNPGLTYYYENGMETLTLTIYQKLITQMFREVSLGQPDL
ncbi:MAG TPA: hypothetical protein VJT15_02665 [Pyrinomonadaceae bacterium]|nr:hypothetical protein [Pyrinomonadaceae bacterium]